MKILVNLVLNALIDPLNCLQYIESRMAFASKGRSPISQQNMFSVVSCNSIYFYYITMNSIP